MDSIEMKYCMILKNEFHLGTLIKHKLIEDGRKVEWLAKKIHCKRDNIYKIFDRASTDTDLLLRISLALKTNFFAYLSEFHQSTASRTDSIEVKYSLMLKNEFHIGKLIKHKLEEDGRRIEWFAKKIQCKRRNIYNIFNRFSIDTEQLLKISLVLQINFFDFLSEFYRNTANKADLTAPQTDDH